MEMTIITGANRGIGLALTQHCHQAGHNILAICRKASPELKALGVETLEECDLSDSGTVAKIEEALGSRAVKLLINNAGILNNEQLGHIKYQSILDQFTINALAPLRLTEKMLPRMAKQAKLVFITSRMGSMGDNTSGGRYGYRMSKAALNAAAVSLAQDLKPKNIAVGIFHPGLVGTDMIGGHGDITPQIAAERLMQRIDEMALSNTGAFFHSNGEVLPW